MNRLLLPFLLFIVQFSAAQKKELPLKIASATSQEWISGAPGGRSGINYSIKIYICTNKKIEFTNVWLGKENIPFNEEFFTQHNPLVKQGDSILLTYNYINNIAVSKDAVTKRLPIEYKGAALIECVVDSRTRYFIVKKFKKIQSLKGR